MSDGAIAPTFGFADYPHKSTNIDLFGDTSYFWLSEMPFLSGSVAVYSGVLTNNTPIDVVSWAVDGRAPFNHSWLNKCNLILTHI